MSAEDAPVATLLQSYNDSYTAAQPAQPYSHETFDGRSAFDRLHPPHRKAKAELANMQESVRVAEINRSEAMRTMPDDGGKAKTLTNSTSHTASHLSFGRRGSIFAASPGDTRTFKF